MDRGVINRLICIRTDGSTAIGILPTHFPWHPWHGRQCQSAFACFPTRTVGPSRTYSGSRTFQWHSEPRRFRALSRLCGFHGMQVRGVHSERSFPSRKIENGLQKVRSQLDPARKYHLGHQPNPLLIASIASMTDTIGALDKRFRWLRRM